MTVAQDGDIPLGWRGPRCTGAPARVLREAADSELALATRREALEAAGAGLQEAAAVGPIDPRRFEWGQVGR